MAVILIVESIQALSQQKPTDNYQSKRNKKKRCHAYLLSLLHNTIRPDLALPAELDRIAYMSNGAGELMRGVRGLEQTGTQPPERQRTGAG
ncbi:hypothetical protein ACMFFG_29470 [Citrobacter freundii]|uniref:hypothetical protein n=1 Tax=Citrobacter freundii TaxID=546 RepID=UPI003CF49475|nr:hypothetical protein [Salmonella enterica]